MLTEQEKAAARQGTWFSRISWGKVEDNGTVLL